MLRELSAVVLTAVVSCAACGSDDQPRLSGYGFSCRKSEQCAAHLTCRYTRCRQVCEADTECADGVCLRSAGYAKGVCALKDEAPCADLECADGLACGADGQCRTACQAGSDCAAGDSCAAGVCAPP